jgi:hypothetical protein
MHNTTFSPSPGPTTLKIFHYSSLAHKNTRTAYNNTLYKVVLEESQQSPQFSQKLLSFEQNLSLILCKWGINIFKTDLC